MEDYSPFGYRYWNNEVYIKLRFTKDKFFKLGIKEYGEYWYTQAGFVIFTAQLPNRSKKLSEFNAKLRTSQP